MDVLSQVSIQVLEGLANEVTSRVAMSIITITIGAFISLLLTRARPPSQVDTRWVPF